MCAAGAAFQENHRGAEPLPWSCSPPSPGLWVCSVVNLLQHGSEASTQHRCPSLSTSHLVCFLHCLMYQAPNQTATASILFSLSSNPTKQLCMCLMLRMVWSSHWTQKPAVQPCAGLVWECQHGESGVGTTAPHKAKSRNCPLSSQHLTSIDISCLCAFWNHNALCAFCYMEGKIWM